MSTEQAATNQQGQGQFREHLPTADASGHRLWIFARKPSGHFYRIRTWISWFLLALMFAGPFIRVNGNPLLMFNVVERKFSIFGQMFWPTDTFIFAICMILFFMMIVVFTAVFGRVWCGWACPQTILMEMVFRKIEWLIDGDYIAQKRLAKAPWTGAKIGKRALKFGVFFAISFVIGNWLLMYVIGNEAWWKVVSGSPRDHVGGLAAMTVFSTVFFLIFARFREQACTFICPYGRFMSVLMDDNSLIVSYDPKRGEKRGKFDKRIARDQRRAAGVGDCIDCRACVDVCPTGIDIRNGLQMECVHCTACIDACDHVMKKLSMPRGLIRYASQRGIEKGEPFRFTPRLAGYCVVLLILGTALTFLLLSRTDVQATIVRNPGTTYQQAGPDRISNIYALNVRNKARRDLPFELRMISPAEGKVSLAGQTTVPGQQMLQAIAIVDLPQKAVHDGKVPVVIGLYSGDRLVQELKSGFIGPDDDGRDKKHHHD